MNPTALHDKTKAAPVFIKPTGFATGRTGPQAGIFRFLVANHNTGNIARNFPPRTSQARTSHNRKAHNPSSLTYSRHSTERLGKGVDVQAAQLPVYLLKVGRDGRVMGPYERKTELLLGIMNRRAGYIIALEKILGSAWYGNTGICCLLKLAVCLRKRAFGL